MQPDRIKISAEFHIMGSGIWLSSEHPIVPGEDPIEEFIKGRDMLIEAFKRINGETHTYSTTPQPVEEQVDEQADKEFEELKLRLSEMEFYEDAKEYLDNTVFKHTIEAKLIINSKKRKV